nr:hypothetical protein [Nocardioides soli]
MRDSGFSRLASSHLSTSAGASRASAAGGRPAWGGFETGASAPSSTTAGGAGASRASTAGGRPAWGGFETGASAPSSTTVGGAGASRASTAGGRPAWGGFETGASAPSSTTVGGAGASRASTAGGAPARGGFETGASAPSSTTVGGAGASRASTAGGPPARGGFETGASAPSSTTVGTSTAGGPVVAVASGRAFTFRYAETEELLRAAGCAVVSFDPLVDPRLPDGTAGIYLGGGFPEVHARELADNVVLRRELAAALADGVPTVAECAGLLYLCRSLDSSPMVGAIPAEAVMTERLTLRYPTMTATTDSLLTRAGETLTGHEFHRTQVLPMTAGRAAWTVDGVDVGFASDSLHASYLHTHWAGHPQLAGRFAAAVHARAATRA